MLRLTCVSHYDEFTRYKDAWEDLLSRSAIDNVFLTYEWVDACIRHFYKDEILLILNVFNGDRLVAIAPLIIRRYRYFGLPVRVVSFIGTMISDRMDFILDSNKKEGISLIMDYLMDMKSDWDFVDFQEMAEYTGNAQIMKAQLKDKRVLNIIGPSTKSFFIGFNGNSRPFYRRFSKKFNKRLKEMNRSNSAYNVRFKRYINKDIETKRIFSDLKAIEGSSWKGKKGLGIFSKADTRNFHREIIDTFSKKKWLDLSVLSFEERPIAYVYNYLYGKRSYNYSIAFDKKYLRVSPGSMLMLWVLRDSISRDVLEFDFARGEGLWKQRLTQDFKAHNRIRIFKNNIYSRFLYYLQSRVMPYMKSKKTLHEAWFRIKEKMGW